MTNLATFDTSALQKKVKDHIQGSFGMLIPEEQFQGLVDAAVKEFFETEQTFIVTEKQATTGSGYHTSTRKWNELSSPISPFKAMVWEHVRILVAEKLKLYFEQEHNELKEQMRVALTPDLESSISNNVALVAQQITRLETAKLVKMSLDMFSYNLQSEFHARGINVKVPDACVVNT